MENIYQLGERFYRISEAYDCAKDALVEEYENNGGEITEATERMEAELKELESLKDDVVNEVLSAPDDYAAIVKNAEAQKKVLEAELDAIKKEQAKVVARVQSRIRRKEEKIAWFKGNIAEAMKLANIEKIGGAKTNNRFSIYFQTTTSIEADDAVLLSPFESKIKELVDSLPEWVTFKTGVNKAVLKKQDTLPDGAVSVENKSLQIR